MNEDTWHPQDVLSGRTPVITTERDLETATQSVQVMASVFSEPYDDSLRWHVDHGLLTTEDADKVRTVLTGEHVDVL